METALVTKHLSKNYKGINVVDDLSMEVPSGSVYGFLGPNGAGKSTTMKMLLGIISPSAGSFSFDSKLVRGRKVRVGSMIEGPSFYANLTAQENLELLCDYLGIERQKGYLALELTGLGRVDKRKASGYFSLGMKQRLGLAMAIAPEPPLLILDEPTNGLDPTGVVEIRNLILEWAKSRKATVLISSHVLSEIEQMADYVGIISNGKLRFQGKLQELTQSGNIWVRTSNDSEVIRICNQLGISSQIDDERVLLPLLSDQKLAHLIKQIVDSHVGIYRVESTKQSLETAFLNLVDPVYISGK